MELPCEPLALENEELIDFGFYDEQKVYGLGFIRLKGSTEIELMVADQSCYCLNEAKISFHKDQFSLSLPIGTISKADGEDEYLVSYPQMTDEHYFRCLSMLKKILEVNQLVILRHS